MPTASFALFALATGAVIGVAAVLLVLWAYRMRSAAAQESAAAVPPGMADVLAALDDAGCVVDASGSVVTISPGAEGLGIRLGTVLADDDLRALVRAARRGGTVQTRTLRLRGAGALDARLVAARASPIGAQLTLLILRDVTERERLEQTRTDFVANTSHELKTPVASVSLLAEAVASAADDPERVRAFAARISAEADRLAHLTGRIMSLSRLQAADGLSHVGPVSVDEVIDVALRAHEVQAESAGVILTRGGDRGLWVRGDAQVLIEAVGNLVANAVQHSPRGAEVGVGVSTSQDAVEIAVADRGEGIADAERERIFERFYRTDRARSRRTGGSGLGLSIVKHATQRHGGEVRVWSQVGRGSTFTVRLPRLDPPAGAAKRKKARTRREAPDGIRAAAEREEESA